MSDAGVHIKFDINGNIYKDKEFVGITGANLTGILLFTFLESDLYATPDFVKKGNAILEYSRLTDTETLETGFIPLGTVRHEDTGEQFGFAIEIKSSLLKYKGNLNLQLHITNQVNGSEEIEVYKSKIFNLYVAESINATKEIPEDYPNWIDEINVRLQEMDNLDIKAERVSNGVEVISTSKTGVESRYLVHDGEKGEQGERGLRGFKGDKGEDGKDGYVQYSAGNNITIENNVISASGGKGISNAFPIYSFRVLNGASMLTGPMNVTANSEIELTTISNIINNALTANVDKFAIFVGTSAISSYSRDLVPFTIEANLSNNPTRIVGDGYHIYLDPNYMYSGSICARLVRGAIIIQGEWANNKFTATSVQIFSSNSDTYSLAQATTVLVKTNTYTYVPTGDYNPSTKLYTDKTHYENMTGYDATKTQTLKNINGVLTWVSDTESGA